LTATAVDLGCKYQLNIEDDGSGVLEVTLGWVSLERDGLVSVVPFGAACRIDDQRGPGTPCYLDASERFRAALSEFDFEDGGENAIAALLAEARPRDGMTLWHLIPRVGKAERERIVDFMSQAWPLPEKVSRDEVVAGSMNALNDWAQSMYWSPPAGSMPSKSKF
jgi:hypothetical protein